jgi:hypothetical protein
VLLSKEDHKGEPSLILFAPSSFESEEDRNKLLDYIFTGGETLPLDLGHGSFPDDWENDEREVPEAIRGIKDFGEWRHLKYSDGEDSDLTLDPKSSFRIAKSYFLRW